MSCLYIIGNGFDLAHAELPDAKELGQYKTKYSDFKDFLKNDCSQENPPCDFCKKICYCYVLRILESIPNLGEDWSNFEGALAEFDIDKLLLIFKELYKAFPCVFKGMDNMGSVFSEDLEISFEKWLNKIQIGHTKCYNNINQDGYYITFNYTDTLEQVYNVSPKNILYIHWKIKNQEHHKCIFGHGKSRYCLKKDNRFQRCWNDPDLYNIFDFIANLEKDYQFKELKERERLIRNCTEVKVIGHSFSDIDKPYFMEIAKMLPKDTPWTYYYYKNIEKATKVQEEYKKTIPFFHICPDVQIKIIH